MIIPKCIHCGEPLKRWGWYWEPTEPVAYWYAMCEDLYWDGVYRRMDALPLTAFIRVLPPGTEVG